MAQEFDQQIDTGERKMAWLTILGYGMLIGSVPTCLWVASLFAGK